jgi:hypothetical protein
MMERDYGVLCRRAACGRAVAGFAEGRTQRRGVSSCFFYEYGMANSLLSREALMRTMRGGRE